MITLISSVILSESRSFANANDLLKSKDPVLDCAATVATGNSHEDL